MTNVVNRLLMEQLGGRSTQSFIAKPGEVFFDPTVGDLRLGDGLTAGGKPMVGDAAKSVYRNFQAGVNFLRATNGRSDIAQIIIHNAGFKVDYINFTENTDNDDFYVSSLIDWQNERNANKVIVITLQGNQDTLDVGDIRSFTKKFIDTVLYTPQDEVVNDLAVAKQAFYDNFTVLKQSLPDGALRENYAFNDAGRVYNPEYNQVSQNGNQFNFYFYIPNDNVFGANTLPYGMIGDWGIVTGGTGYAVGDKITVNGAQLNGVNGENDLTVTVQSVKQGNIIGLNMTNPGTNFEPQPLDGYGLNNSYNVFGGSGSGAQIHVENCNYNGSITSYSLRNGGGYNYQVGDTITINNGGDNAVFEVVSVGVNGIENISLDGMAYLGSPTKIENGYWPKMAMGYGFNDNDDFSNYISTQNSSWGVLADFYNNRMTIVNYDHSGSVPLTPGMWCVAENNNGDYAYFRLLSQASDDNNTWYIQTNYGGSPFGTINGLKVRIDGIPYRNGQIQVENDVSDAFGQNSAYVTVYNDSIFAMMAFNTFTNSVYYNGDSGADGRGYKQIEVVLGASTTPFENRSIPQNKINNSQYTIMATDAGKHIYNINGNNDVNVPPATTENFPIGTAITVVSGNDITWIHPLNSDITQIWGAGFNKTSIWWAIPANSMATLLKIGPDKWMVSGAGLYDDN